MQDVIEAQVAADLTPDSPVLADNRECVTNKMADSGSSMADTRMIMACGCNPPWFTKPASILFPNGFDGIIGSESCSGGGAGFSPTRTRQLGCYPLSHTQLETNRPVINDVALHLTGSPTPYVLITTPIGTGSGTINVSPPGPNYARGLATKVTLTAVADSGSTFMGWSGDASGMANPTTVTMTANRTVTAMFTKNRVLTITKAGTGSGAVTASPPGLNPPLSYTNNTPVTLTATPDAVSTFVGWSGDATSTARSVSLTMSADKSVTATFKLPAIWLKGSGGTAGEALGSASGCGLSSQLSLADAITVEVYYDGASDSITGTVSGVADSPEYSTLYYYWQGALTWNGTSFTGFLDRTDNPARPSLFLMVTRQTNGQYLASTSVPFTYLLYRLDGSCTGPLYTFDYALDGIVLTPQ